MERVKFCRNLKFIYENKKCRILDVDDGIITFEETLSGRRQVANRMSLEKKLLLGQLSLIRLTDQCEHRLPHFDELTEAQKKTITKRSHYVSELHKRSSYGGIRSHINKVIKIVSEELDDSSPPSRATIYRWYKSWVGSDYNALSLLPRHYTRKQDQERLDPKIQSIIMEVIEEHYLVLEKPSVQNIIPFIKFQIDHYNQKNCGEDKLNYPSSATIYRYVNKIDPYLKMLKREGKKKADHYFQSIKPGLKVEAPLDVVEIDHTVLDIQVLSEDAGYVSRPTLTIALDRFSRMPVGFYLGFTSAGYESLMECMYMSMMPKERLLASFGIEGSWPCHGIFRNILIDNGMEFHSGSLREACLSLGISITHHPVKQPHFKGPVERFFGTVNNGFLKPLKGKTFSNIVEKGDYNPVEEAVIPFPDLYEAFLRWLVEVYGHDFHRGINDFPVNKWLEGVEKYPVDLPVSADSLLILLSSVYERNLSRHGIQVNSIIYNSDELNHLFRQYGKVSRVKVKIDPANVGWAYVYDEFTGKYLKVSSDDHELEGMSLWKFKVIKKQINERRKKGEAEFSIHQNFVDIQKQLADKSKKTKSHRRAARLLSNPLSRQNQKNKKHEIPQVKEVKKSNVVDFQSILQKAKKDWG